ncbi:MAG TPA: ABC transporter permease subunit, partial [Rhizomicrobium sp.]|nr:ABC transporter permease subunit [Rhizomicrobium sp.]
MIANQALYVRRRFANGVFIFLSIAAAVFGLIWLAFILGSLLADGLSGLSPDLFTKETPPPGAPGGLANAIVGSVMMSAVAVLAGTPIGLFAGTYLAEYGKHSRLAFVVRFVNDILLSAPSIVTGLFIYEILVVPMGHFSGWAGAASLMVIVIPVVVRTTENMLLLVPNGLREAASALGAA